MLEAIPSLSITEDKPWMCAEVHVLMRVRKHLRQKTDEGKPVMWH